MKLLCQRDLQWCSDKLGQSNLTVGRFGCCITSISMLSDYFKCYRSPKELAHNVALFTMDGLVNWQALHFDHMRFESRLQGRSDATIQNCLNSPDRAIMLNVNQGQHWVVAIKKTLFGNSYIVADPWTGQQCDVIKVYKDITGSAIFTRI